MRVKDVLATKGAFVATISTSATVADVVAELDRHNVGALVVSAGGGSVDGIVSERDVARALHRLGASVLLSPVSEIMTTPVDTCLPEDEIGVLARTMTTRRFRHIPVVVDGALAGIVSIGDIVKKRIDELEAEHAQLVNYISSTG